MADAFSASNAASGISRASASPCAIGNADRGAMYHQRPYHDVDKGAGPGPESRCAWLAIAAMSKARSTTRSTIPTRVVKTTPDIRPLARDEHRDDGPRSVQPGPAAGLPDRDRPRNRAPSPANLPLRPECGGGIDQG